VRERPASLGSRPMTTVLPRGAELLRHTGRRPRSAGIRHRWARAALPGGQGPMFFWRREFYSNRNKQERWSAAGTWRIMTCSDPVALRCPKGSPSPLAGDWANA